MKTRTKILIVLQPPLWVILYCLVSQPHEEARWWSGFFLAVAMLICLLAVLRLGHHVLVRKVKPSSPSEVPITRRSSAFTLIELLTVIVIIGLIVAITAPAVTHLLKGDSTLAATRQILDDCARARQLAISQRTTVYMVFVHTNFWQDVLRPFSASDQWASLRNLALPIVNSTTVTQLYNAQWTGYAMYSLRGVGDQPGAFYPKDLLRVRTLPQGAFIAPLKFTAPQYPAAPFVIRTNFPIYGFLRTNNIPFPTADAFTNANYVNQIRNNPSTVQCPTVAYIAFNYLGQLTRGDGNILPYDENIPLAHGTIVQSHDRNKNPTNAPPTATEVPPGNSTNISYNIIHIDRLTGRARLERAEAL